MPKERINKAGREGYADLLVQWGRDEIGDHHDVTAPRVRLFLIAPELGPQGGFYFSPRDEDAERMGIGPGNSVGPVDVMLDREQINRMIRVLRRARDQAYGRDE